MTHDELDTFLLAVGHSDGPGQNAAANLAVALTDIRDVLGDRWWPAHETLEGAVRNLVNVAVLDEEVRAAQKARIEELEKENALLQSLLDPVILLDARRSRG